MTFTAIIPVKRWADAKRRLALPPQIRSELARAFAEDVIRAVVDCREIDRVVVVSSEPDVREIAARFGVELIPDPVRTGGDPLNASIRTGVEWAARQSPVSPVAVVPADLPCLTGGALEAALAGLDDLERGRVADATGDGTTLLLAARPELLDPAYGEESAARHLAAGYDDVVVPAELRRDVDSLADLAEAVVLGIGRATEAALERHPLDLAG